MGGRLLGYARVSTADRQDLALQLHALAGAGVAEADTYTDTASGARADRPGLARMLAEADRGSTVIMWRLDRLGRSVRDLADLAHRLREQGVGIRSLTDGVDTTTSAGRLVYGMLSSIAEYEREMIRERVTAGMAAAKRAGIHVGRRSVMSADRAAEARRMLADGRPARQVAGILRVSEATLYRALLRFPGIISSQSGFRGSGSSETESAFQLGSASNGSRSIWRATFQKPEPSLPREVKRPMPVGAEGPTARKRTVAACTQCHGSKQAL